MTVLIVSRVQFLREMLQQALRSAAGIVALDGSDPDLIEAAHGLVPDIVIVDSSHPDGFARIRALRARFPDILVIVLAIGESDEDFFAWASIGIAGYVEPETSTEELVAIIRRAGAGETVCPPRLTALLLSRFSQQAGAGGPARASVHVLTGRERDVLLLLAEGLSNKLIARQLSLAEATVKNHVHSILEKWDLRSRGEAAACYRQSIADSAFLRGSVAPARHLSPPPLQQPGLRRPQPAAALSMRSDRTSGTGP